MRWDEYVEDVTEGIPDRRRAREVRRELRDHLETAAKAGVAQGLSRSEAEDQALASMGPAPELARQFRVAYLVGEPIWPAVAALLAALAGVALIVWPATDQQPGITAGLLMWSALWAAGHPKSFLSLLRLPRPVAFPRHLVQVSWPFAGAGVLTATLLVAAVGGVLQGTAWPLLFPLLAWALWEGANALCRRQESVHPVGSGLATLFLLLTLGLTWSVAPQLGPGTLGIGPATAPTQLSWAALLAVLYFTGAAILANGHAFIRARLGRMNRVADTH